MQVCSITESPNDDKIRGINCENIAADLCWLAVNNAIVNLISSSCFVKPNFSSAKDNI